MSKRLLMPERFQKSRVKKVDPPLPPAREDGRPLYYDIAPGDIVQCALCILEGKWQQYRQNEGFMNDPANPPVPMEPRSVHTICRGHLPDNAVIFNPKDQTCRNKEGADTWREGPWEDLRADPSKGEPDPEPTRPTEH